MKIIHIGDCHVGKRPYGLRQREKDIQRAVEDVVRQAVTADADVFIWPGDIWESVKPTAESVKFVQKMVDKLARNNIVSVGIDGNHDSTGGKWLEIAGIHSLDGEPYTAKGVTIAGFHNRSPERMLEMIDDQEQDIPKCDVLVLHQAIAEMANFNGAVLNKDFLYLLADITGARYVAMGDIHQFVLHTDKSGREYCYPGSVEVLSSDEPKDKFFCEVDITKKKLSVESRAIATRPYRDVVVTSEEDLESLSEIFREAHGAFFDVTVGAGVSDGVKRCKALIKASEVLARVWLAKPDCKREKVVWKRKDAIVDVEAAVNESFPEGSDENRLVKALLANPDTLKETIEEFVSKNTGKKNE